MHTVLVNGRPQSPSKILCIGRNYVAHIEELGNEMPRDMVVFMKPNCALTDTLRAHSGEPLHYESELVFSVAAGQIGSVGFGLDLTKRGLQSKLKAAGLPWERAKAFDGSALCSALVPVPANIDSLALRLRVDGELRQQGGVAMMIYKPATILAELQAFTSLEDGDIIMTGTPAGVGAVQSGEHFEGEVLAGDDVLLSANWTAQ